MFAAVSNTKQLKAPSPERQNFMWLKPAKPGDFNGWLRENFCFSSFDFPVARQIR